MSEKKPEIDPFQSAIEAKIAAWKTVLDSYRAAKALDGPLSEPGGIVAGVESVAGTSRVQAVSHGTAPVGLPVGVFRDKSLKEAIPIYLGAVRRRQTNKDIAIGLKDGGFPTTAENFEATVATALYRLKNDGVLLRFPDGWDLASSYPESLRTRLEKGERKPRRRTRTVKRRQRGRKPTTEAPENATKQSPEPLRAVV